MARKGTRPPAPGRTGKRKRLVAAANKLHSKALLSANNAVEYALECGRKLLALKETFQVGAWESFVERSFTGSIRTAQKYMRIARHWDEISVQGGDASKSQLQATKAITALLGSQSEEEEKPVERTKRTAVRLTGDAALKIAESAVAELRRAADELLELGPQNMLLESAAQRLREAAERLSLAGPAIRAAEVLMPGDPPATPALPDEVAELRCVLDEGIEESLSEVGEDWENPLAHMEDD